MTPASLSLLFGCAALLAHVLIVPVVLRAAPRAAPIKLHAAVLAAVHLMQVAAALIYGLSSGVAIPYWHGAILLGAGAIGYVFLFSAVYKSVSLRILGQVRAAGGRSPIADIERALIRPEFVNRIDLLREAGLIVEQDGAYAITSRGARLAERLQAAQRFFGVSGSGLY